MSNILLGNFSYFKSKFFSSKIWKLKSAKKVSNTQSHGNGNSKFISNYRQIKTSTISNPNMEITYFQYRESGNAKGLNWVIVLFPLTLVLRG